MCLLAVFVQFAFGKGNDTTNNNVASESSQHSSSFTDGHFTYRSKYNSVWFVWNLVQHTASFFSDKQDDRLLRKHEKLGR